MDPDKALEQISDALRGGAIVEAYHLRCYLLQWLANGGFVPDHHSHPTLVEAWHYVVTGRRDNWTMCK